MENHIKIHGISPRIQYVADGLSSTFEFPFAIFKNENLEVYIGETLQNTNTYTVSGAGNSDGGSVTFLSAPTSGSIITLFRKLSIERTTDFQEGGALRANALNYELDYQIACQQQIADNMNRAMMFPPYATNTNVDLTLPTPSAGKAIVWNSAGTNLENSTVEVNALESTLNGYKTAAESAATTATTKAGIASDKADIATEKAQIATQKATEVSEALSTKANVAMDNITAAGKKVISNMAFPTGAKVDFTLGASGSTYTAPADGWLIIDIRSNAETAQYVQLVCGGMYAINLSEKTNNREICTMIPMSKGQIATYNYTTGGTVAISRFVYAKGGNA